jgi:hypothetical protein
MTTRRSFLLPVVLLAAVVAACNPTSQALPPLDDPKEILEEALRTTAELEFVHAKVDAGITAGGGDLLAAQAYTVEGDLDLAQREFHAAVTASGGGIGDQRAEMLLVGTDMFMRLQGNEQFPDPASGQWQRMPIDAGTDPRSGIPATPAIAVALKALLADPGITTMLDGTEACGDGQCYHVTATVAPDLTWRALNGGLLGGQPGADIGPPDPAVPELVFDILVDQATRRLMSVGTTVDIEGMSADLAATFSNHDVEFDLLPPPPDQVMDPNEGGGFGAPGVAPESILEEVGNEVQPTP